MKSLGAAAVAGVILSGCAPVATQPMASGAAPGGPGAAAPTRQCFNANNVNGFQVVDERTVDLNVGASRIYRVELFGTCPDVRGAISVGVRSRSGSSFICEDVDVDLIVPSESRQDVRRCPATGLRRLTDAEVAAKRGRR